MKTKYATNYYAGLVAIQICINCNRDIEISLNKIRCQNCEKHLTNRKKTQIIPL